MVRPIEPCSSLYVTSQKIPHELENNVKVVAVLHEKLLSNIDLKFDLVWTFGPIIFAVFMVQVYQIFTFTG